MSTAKSLGLGRKGNSQLPPCSSTKGQGLMEGLYMLQVGLMSADVRSTLTLVNSILCPVHGTTCEQPPPSRPVTDAAPLRM